jgi:cell wall-associated NlpC family hydrolase
MATARHGDLIYVERYGGIYQHYGIYVGEDKVIHRTENGVRQTSLEKFCKDSHS